MQKQERVCEECYKLAAGEEKVEVDGPPSPPRTPKREGVLNVRVSFLGGIYWYQPSLIPRTKTPVILICEHSDTAGHCMK